MTETPRFKVIEGGEKPKAGRSNKRGDRELLICKCGSSTTREVQVNRTVKNGKVYAGTKMIKCDLCGETLV